MNRRLIAQDVAQQLEQRENQQQNEECGKNHPQVDKEIAQHIVIEQRWKAGAENAAAGGGALERVGAVSASKPECQACGR